MRNIILIVHNVRSAHNVGSLLRTADGLGIEKVYLSGYTPYPHLPNDTRLPHIANKTHSRIAKTALGAELNNNVEHSSDAISLINNLKRQSYRVCALEQTANSINLAQFKPEGDIALIVGREVEGLEPEIIKAVETTIQIPMFGQKESFNVAAAAAMALYHLRFF